MSSEHQIDAAPARIGRPRKPMREILMSKVSRPDGMSREDIVNRIKGSRRSEGAQVLDQLVGEGVIHRAQSTGGPGRPAVRYFSDKADAERWKTSRVEAKKADTTKTKLKGLASKALAPLTAQAAGKAWRNLQQRLEPTPAIVPATVKRTVCPSVSFDPRFQCDPRQRVVGGFATMGPGRYLDGGAS